MYKIFRSFEKLFIVSAMIVMLGLTSASIPVAGGGTYSSWGPKIDYLLIKIYYDLPQEIQALLTGDVDIIDWPIDAETYFTYIEGNPDFVSPPLTMYDLYDIDINNLRWPTSDVNFRRAIADLIDYEYFYTDVLQAYSGSLMDNIIPPEWTNWYNPNAPKYEYNTTKAEEILAAAGYQDWDLDLQMEYKNSSGTFELPPLMFYVRSDDSFRLSLGRMLRDEMLALGIPLDYHEGNYDYCSVYAYETYEYNLYTAGMGPFTDAQYLYDFYHSQFATPEEPWCMNNVFFINSTYDDLVETMKFAPDLTTAITACKDAQEIFMDQVPIIPVYRSAGTIPYRAKYGNWPGEEAYFNKTWEGVVNAIWPTTTCGTNDWWTPFNAHPEGFTKGGVLRYGTMGDVSSVNPVMQYWYWDAIVLNEIYDTLIRYDPYEEILMPWLARGYNVETWDNGGTPATKLTFKLRSIPPVKWNDGETMNSSDVAFTMKYMYDAGAPLFYPAVEKIDGIDTDTPHIETPDANTVVIYYTVESIWALKWAGLIPIIPKHVWENIPPEECESKGEYVYGPNAGNLTGTGPFVIISHTEGESWTLRANPTYFAPTYFADGRTIPGDCAGSDPMAPPWSDGQVFWQDLLVVLVGYGAKPNLLGDTRWTDYSLERADFNLDDQIFWQDLLQVLVNYGAGDP